MMTYIYYVQFHVTREPVTSAAFDKLLMNIAFLFDSLT